MQMLDWLTMKTIEIAKRITSLAKRPLASAGFRLCQRCWLDSKHFWQDTMPISIFNNVINNKFDANAKQVLSAWLKL